MMNRSIPITINSSLTAHEDNDSDGNVSSNDGSFGPIPVSGLSESLSNLGLTNNRNYHRHSMAQSLPPPRAPFLSARNLPGDRLSSIPQMSLPESAEASIASSSDQQVETYGSLRNSRFHFHRRSNMDSVTRYGEADTLNSDEITRSSVADDAALVVPRSVPTHKEIDRDWVAKRWAEQRYRNRQNKIQMQLEETNNDSTSQQGIERKPLAGLSEALAGSSFSSLHHLDPLSKSPGNGLLTFNETNQFDSRKRDGIPMNSAIHSQYEHSNGTTSPSSAVQPQLSTSLTAFEMLETSRKGGQGSLLSMSMNIPVSSSVNNNYNRSTGFNNRFNDEYKHKDVVEETNNVRIDGYGFKAQSDDNWEKDGSDYNGQGYTSDPDTFEAFEME